MRNYKTKSFSNESKVYKFRRDAKTFDDEFYYINFLDANNQFINDFCVKLDNMSHAMSRAKWYLKNRWALKGIDYFVRKIGVYSSERGHIKSYSLNN